MDVLSRWTAGLNYDRFLDKYATPEQRRRWDAFRSKVGLTPSQQATLRDFRREMLVIVVAGAWCGDCIQQVPIFDHFSKQAPCLQFRYFDREDHGDLADELSICGGRRVPSVLFLSEDGAPCGRAGDRTLSKYRDMVATLDGASCPTGIVAPVHALLSDVTQDWLNEFERVQLMLRLSPRLRQKHGD